VDCGGRGSTVGLGWELTAIAGGDNEPA